MSINLSGSLVLTGSLAVTGEITMSGSIASASYAASSSYALNAELLDNRDSSTFANTGSNIFSDGQYVSSSYNPTGFSTTASLYTDGGLRVTKDAYISGTLYLNNVTVYGTQSVCYITSSQLNIASNLISVNTATPSVRYGGLAVYDSGSTSLTGSILWDSEANHWIYSNPSGSSYSGGMFISGPRTSTLGSETGTTACMLLAGQGGDHLTSSMIYHSSNATCFYGNATITSTGAASFSSCIAAGGLISATTEFRLGASFARVATLDAGGGFGGGYNLNWNNGSPVHDSTGALSGYGYVNDGSIRLYTNNSAAANTAAPERFRINASGIACFSSTTCAPHFIGANNISIGSNCTTTSGYNTRFRITNLANDTFVFSFNNQACKAIMYMYGGNTSNPQGYTAWLDNTTGNVNHQISHNTAETTYFAALGGSVGIGTTNVSSEANLFLGARNTTEGGQLVLQKATSCSCATHLDNYQNSFRILSGNDVGSTAAHFILDHVTKNATFYGNLSIPYWNFGGRYCVVGTTFAVIGPSQTYSGLHFVSFTHSNAGNTGYALMMSAWYPGQLTIISQYDPTGLGVCFRMNGNNMEMKTSSGTVNTTILNITI